MLFRSRHTTRLIQDVIRHGVLSDAFAAPNVPATGRAVLSLCVDVARWYRDHNGETPEQIGDLNAQLALRMLGAREGVGDPQAGSPP